MLHTYILLGQFKGFLSSNMEFCFNSVSCSSFYPAFVFEVLKDAEDLVQHQFGRFVVGASTLVNSMNLEVGEELDQHEMYRHR